MLFFADIILNKMFYELNIYIILFQCNVNDNLNSLVFQLTVKKFHLQRANLIISSKNGKMRERCKIMKFSLFRYNWRMIF